MKTYLPKNLNLAEHVQLNEPTEVPNFSIDKLAYLLHLVSEIPANNKDLLMRNGYTPMYSPLLKKAEYHYRKYLDYAVRTGILLEDHQYIVDKKSRGFKFAPEYSSRLVEHISTNARFMKSIRRKRKKEIDLPRDISFLAKSFLDGGLEFDYESALELLDRRDKFFDRYPDQIPLNKKGKPKNPLEQYNSALMNFQRLHDHDYYISVDPSGGRLHTNITNMPSDWRNFLSYKGESLVSIDIRNCQPYLSSLTLQPGFYDYDHEAMFSSKNFSGGSNLSYFDRIGFTIQNLTNNTINKLQTNHTNYNTLIMLVESTEPLVRQEFMQYSEMCSNGVLYKYLEDKMGEELGAHYKNPRAVKIAIFQTMFSDNRFIGLEEAKPKRVFSHTFPNVYKAFCCLKRPDKTILPCLLQSMESHLVLHVICKRIHRDKPKLSLFTVHDSIVTTENNANYVQHIMEEELTRHIGLPPTLKTERWHPDEVKELYIHP